jgi:4'-phosphopantetheinyl transferase
VPICYENSLTVAWLSHGEADILWSAKESALKVLRTGFRPDSRSVEVALALGPKVEAWLPLSVTMVEGRRFSGWWRGYGSFLLTVAAEAEIPPPVAMVEPPGLATGVPTHRWLATLA